MKDSQLPVWVSPGLVKYIKANDERFSSRSVGRPVIKY